MKLVWSPETAAKAYIDTIKSVSNDSYPESGTAELIAAMAAGWNAQLIVETWSRGGPTATSTGLATASRHTGGRHVCIVADEESRSEYIKSMGRAGADTEVVVGDGEEVMLRLKGVDFLVVDCRRRDFARVLNTAKVSHRGAVLVCKNATSKAHPGFSWRTVLDAGSRLVRSVFLPVGKGLDIAHVGSGGAVSGPEKRGRRWITRIDQQTGELHVFRK